MNQKSSFSLETFFFLGIGFLSAIGSAVLAPVLPIIQDDFNLTAAEIGLLTSSFGMARLLLDLPVGYMVGRYDPYKIQMTGALISIASSIWAALAPDFALLLVARALSGAGASLVSISSMVLITSVGDARHRGRDLGLYQASMQSAFSIGPLVAGFMVPVFNGWQGVFYVTAAFSALALPIIIRLKPAPIPGDERTAGADARRSPTGTEQQVKGQPADAGVTTGGQGKSNDQHDADEIANIRLRRWNILIAHACTFTLFFTVRGFSSSILPLYGGNIIGMSAAALGIALGINSVMRILLSIVGGFVADRYGHRAILVPGLFFMGVVMAALTLVHSAAGFFLFSALLGLTRFGNNVPAALLADNVSRGAWGRSMGMNRFIGDFAVVLGPVLLGYFVDVSGYLTTALFCAVLSFASAALAMSIATAKERKDARPHMDTSTGN